MSESLVTYENRSPAAIITLNRPDKRNALSRQLIADLRSAFERVAEDEDARCVILTGAGKVFCSGMDLAELQNSLDIPEDETPVWDDAQRLAQLYDLIYKLPKPTIAALNGAAVAGGAGLMTVCDLALATPTVKIGYPEVRRGLVAAMVMPHLLRHIGERSARFLLLAGELLDAQQSERCGLINSIVEPDELINESLQLARSLAEGGPAALARTKELLNLFSHQAVSVEDAAKASAAPRLTKECQDGLRAFFEKKPAPWTIP